MASSTQASGIVAPSKFGQCTARHLTALQCTARYCTAQDWALPHKATKHCTALGSVLTAQNCRRTGAAVPLRALHCIEAHCTAVGCRAGRSVQCNSGAVCREPARGAELGEGVTEVEGSE